MVSIVDPDFCADTIASMTRSIMWPSWIVHPSSPRISRMIRMALDTNSVYPILILPSPKPAISCSWRLNSSRTFPKNSLVIIGWFASRRSWISNGSRALASSKASRIANLLELPLELRKRAINIAAIHERKTVPRWSRKTSPAVRFSFPSFCFFESSLPLVLLLLPLPFFLGSAMFPLLFNAVVEEELAKEERDRRIEYGIIIIDLVGGGCCGIRRWW